MSTFHTIVVNAKGDIAHSNNNFINTAINEAGWDKDVPYLMLYWDGLGDIPQWDMNDWTEQQQKSVINHYTKLSQLLKNDIACLEYFSDEKYEDVRCVLAYDSTSLDLLRLLSKDKRLNVKQALCLNDNLPNEIFYELLKNDDIIILGRIAEHSNVPINVLIDLSKHDSDYIRNHVASNHNTPTEILDILSQDENKFVRECVANNPNISLDTLKKLSQDTDNDIRRCVANNDNCPIEILNILAQDEDDLVRYEVAYNPNVTVDILKLLENDKQENTRKAVSCRILDFI